MKVTYRLTPQGDHTSLRIWINGALAGLLTVRNDERDALFAIIRALDALSVDGSDE